MPKRKEKKVPVFFSISELLSLQTLLRKKIEIIDEEVRNKRAMYEQREALRERIHYFDDLNTKIHIAMTDQQNESDLGLAQQRIFEWMNSNSDNDPLSVISNLYEFGAKRWFIAVEKDQELQEAFDTVNRDNKAMRSLIMRYLTEQDFEKNKK
ncbi:hypothetical protein NNC41_08045 [Enterococcus faecium]|nr:hypothetical protein [Enterococcus faecium]HAQ1518027.1 hypothetical protein [Enterococcus faecium]